MATLSYDEFPQTASEDREKSKQTALFLDQLYRNKFDREPDKEGKNYWYNQLMSGAMDRESVSKAFDASEEGQRIAGANNNSLVNAQEIKQEISQIAYPGEGWDGNNGDGSSKRNKEERLNEMKQQGGISDNAGFKGLLNDKVGLPIAAGALATVFTGDSNKSKLTNAVLAAGGASILQHMLGNKGKGQQTPSVELDTQNAEVSGLGVGPSASTENGDNNANGSVILDGEKVDLNDFYNFPLGANSGEANFNRDNNIKGAFSSDTTISQAANTNLGETTELQTFVPDQEQGVLKAHIINPGSGVNDADTLDAQEKTNSLLNDFKNVRVPNALFKGGLTA